MNKYKKGDIVTGNFVRSPNPTYPFRVMRMASETRLSTKMYVEDRPQMRKTACFAPVLLQFNPEKYINKQLLWRGEEDITIIIE